MEDITRTVQRVPISIYLNENLKAIQCYIFKCNNLQQ